MRRLKACGVAAVLGAAGCSAPADPAPATYYVAADGDDSASGHTPEEAWGSLARATEHHLRPGETLMLDGDRPLRGSLRVTSDDAGDPARPVHITAAPAFPGIIAEGHAGVDIVDTSGVEVSDLRIAAADPEAGTNGVLVTVSPGEGWKEGITLRDLRIDATHQGVAIGVEEITDGISDVTIERVAVTDARRNGIITYGTTAPDHSVTDVRITGSSVTGTRGLAEEETNTGSGIVVGSAEGALVEDNVVSHNGEASDAPEGPIGLWTHDSTDVIIRGNVAHHNRTRWTDGGGFGVDISSTDVLVEHNLSHDNDGAGFLVYTRSGALPTGGVTFRYNASVGDGRHPQLPAGFAVLGGLDTVDADTFVHDIHVHHNTVLPAVDAGASALLVMGNVENVRVHHNILDTSAGDAPAVLMHRVAARGDLLLQANHLAGGASLLEREGSVARTPEEVSGLLPGAADNGSGGISYLDVADLPGGLAPIRPLTVELPRDDDRAEVAPAGTDLAGTPVSAPNPAVGAVTPRPRR